MHKRLLLNASALELKFLWAERVQHSRPYCLRRAVSILAVLFQYFDIGLLGGQDIRDRRRAGGQSPDTAGPVGRASVQILVRPALKTAIDYQPRQDIDDDGAGAKTRGKPGSDHISTG